MKIRAQERGQILILMGAWLLLTGGASSALLVYERPASEVERAVKRALPESERRDRILIAIKRWESTQTLRDEMVSEDRELLLDALRRRETERDQVTQFTRKLDTSFAAMDQDFLDLRFRIRQEVTSSEWAAIVAQPAE